MKKFLIRTCNVIVIVAALLGYNHVAKAHEAQDAEAKADADAANAEVEAALAELAGDEETQSAYTDGVYQGTATGFGGDITVEITVEDGEITDLTILSAEKRGRRLSDDGGGHYRCDSGRTERGCGYRYRSDIQLHRH